MCKPVCLCVQTNTKGLVLVLCAGVSQALPKACTVWGCPVGLLHTLRPCAGPVCWCP